MMTRHYMAIQQMLWFRELLNNLFMLTIQRFYIKFILAPPCEFDRISPLNRCEN